MINERVAEMTLEELTALIDQRIKLAGTRRRELDEHTREEAKASIRRNRIVPPPGSKSALELLREDRDS